MCLKTSFSNQLILECGCDEAGRGALAGPLYTAAVIFPLDFYHAEINDSKKLSPQKREKLVSVIEEHALAWSVKAISPQTIDQINILNATFLGMNQAILELKMAPELLLIDGNRFKNQTPFPHVCCIKGDATYLSMAAASILAKTYRDHEMERLAKEFPEYHWDENKGYPTPFHQQQILKIGLSPYHRKSYKLKSQLKLDFF
jgi:ribonuclease HII